MRGTLSAESFKKGRQRYKALNIFKQDIEKNLKYIQMHNTYIELIAEAFKIPEMEVLKVSTNSIDRQFEIANNHTKELREEEKAKAPSSQVKVYFDPVFDIQPAPPISEELTSLLLSDLKKYLSVIDCYNNLEAQALREDIFSYSPRSNAAKDYRAVIEEIIGGAQNG